MNARSAFFAALTALSTGLVAQSPFDIGIFQANEGMLDVRVRPTSDFDGVFSSLVFTLRYDRNIGIELGDPVQPADVAPLMTITRSGALREDGSFAYQVFAGFGFQNMQSAGAHWEAGKEYTVLSIPVSGSGSVELVNDAWTGEVRNNGDFYVSLGGLDRTGQIYRSMAAAGGSANEVVIQPNPNQGEFMFSFTSVEPTNIRLELLNTLGQTVYNEQLRNYEGTFRKDMDLTAQSNGIYYLKITRGNDLSVHKVVYR
jgi:hypothetical protein